MMVCYEQEIAALEHVMMIEQFFVKFAGSVQKTLINIYLE